MYNNDLVKPQIDEEQAWKLINLHNLSRQTFDTWRRKGYIPKCYLNDKDIFIEEINVSEFLRNRDIPFNEMCRSVGVSRMGGWKWRKGGLISGPMQEAIKKYMEKHS